MKTRAIPNQLKDVTRKLARGLKPEKIILFGSWAWGNPTSGSDFDLFIIQVSTLKRLEREKSAYRIICKSELSVDVLVYTPAEVKRRLSFEDPFVTQIVTRGRILYAR